TKTYASASATTALQAFVWACSYCPSRGCLGSSKSGRFTSARSTSRVSNLAWRSADPENHFPTSRPTRPGRGLPMITWGLGIHEIYQLVLYFGNRLPTAVYQTPPIQS